MTNYLNLEKPNEADLNWGDSINSNSDKIDAECRRLNSELGNKANTNHTHSGFAPASHNHNDLYSQLNHSHNNFALTVHTHSEITTLQNRMTLAENRINTLFSDTADKSYVINLLKNFDHSVAGLTPQIHMNGQGSNSQNLRVNCWINSPAFLLEWHLSFHWVGLPNPSNRLPQHSQEFSINKPAVNAPYWGGNNVTSITIRVKCRNPFLQNDWSNEAVLTDSEIFMFNFIDADKIVAALAVNSNFQTTLASVICTNPGLVEKIVHQANNTQSSAL
jgi:hypothetical protein